MVIKDSVTRAVTEYRITIDVVSKIIDEIQINETEKAVAVKAKKKNKRPSELEAKITKIDIEGLVTVKFSAKLI